MQVKTERLGDGISVVRVIGRLNMVSAPQLRQAVAKLIDSGTVRLCIDLSQTEFMDSTGLGALIGSLKAARAAGGDLRIASPSAQVALVLRLTNTEGLLGATDNALKAYEGG